MFPVRGASFGSSVSSIRKSRPSRTSNSRVWHALFAQASQRRLSGSSCSGSSDPVEPAWSGCSPSEVGSDVSSFDVRDVEGELRNAGGGISGGPEAADDANAGNGLAAGAGAKGMANPVALGVVVSASVDVVAEVGAGGTSGGPAASVVALTRGGWAPGRVFAARDLERERAIVKNY